MMQYKTNTTEVPAYSQDVFVSAILGSRGVVKEMAYLGYEKLRRTV